MLPRRGRGGLQMSGVVGRGATIREGGQWGSGALIAGCINGGTKSMADARRCGWWCGCGGQLGTGQCGSCRAAGRYARVEGGGDCTAAGLKTWLVLSASDMRTMCGGWRFPLTEAATNGRRAGGGAVSGRRIVATHLPLPYISMPRAHVALLGPARRMLRITVHVMYW